MRFETHETHGRDDKFCEPWAQTYCWENELIRRRTPDNGNRLRFNGDVSCWTKRQSWKRFKAYFLEVECLYQKPKHLWEERTRLASAFSEEKRGETRSGARTDQPDVVCRCNNCTGANLLRQITKFTVSLLSKETCEAHIHLHVWLVLNG